MAPDKFLNYRITTQLFLNNRLTRKNLGVISHLQSCILCCSFSRQFKEANSGHLWSNIQAAITEEYPNALPTNLTVPLIMKSWETQSGYPVINAIRDYSTYRVTLSQVIN